MNYAKGLRFERGDGTGYELTRNVSWGDCVETTDFEPFGGAPAIISDIDIPSWLRKEIQAYWSPWDKALCNPPVAGRVSITNPSDLTPEA